MKEIYIHRGLHMISQMYEKRLSTTFYYILKLYMHAPPEFWENWQARNDKPFFKKFISVFLKS